MTLFPDDGPVPPKAWTRGKPPADAFDAANRLCFPLLKAQSDMYTALRDYVAWPCDATLLKYSSAWSRVQDITNACVDDAHDRWPPDKVPV